MILEDLTHKDRDQIQSETTNAIINPETNNRGRRVPKEATYGRMHKEGGTFGAASPCKSLTQSEISALMNGTALTASINQCSPSPSPKPTKHVGVRKTALLDAYLHLFEEKTYGWDVAMALHLPYHLAHTKVIEPSIMVEKFVNKYFDRVERKMRLAAWGKRSH